MHVLRCSECRPAGVATGPRPGEVAVKSAGLVDRGNVGGDLRTLGADRAPGSM